MSSTQPLIFDVIVVGGGHAGVESANAAARMGAKTLLLTDNIDTIGQMSCNPAIGGIGKGQLVFEIDALDGIMPKASEIAGIQRRKLNRKKGAAVQGTRFQACRALYKQAVRNLVESQKNLTLFQQSVFDLIIENDTVCGVITQLGLSLYAKAVVLTVGTFLSGKIHIGTQHYPGGRAGCAPSIPLAETLRKLPFRVGRLKTGTPPRIDGASIDFSQLERQEGDLPMPYFSYLNDQIEKPTQLPCYIAHTNKKTHEIIQANLNRSAMYSGNIEGIGPRYCPSIEDKIVRFQSKDAHQIFIEPEGLHTNEIYPNGISTSLPFDVQLAFVRSMKGLEQAHITRAGYAIEYDYFDPRDLKASLETKFIRGLFFAGQINGTTGYEEAAAQGIVAGINAVCYLNDRLPFTPDRAQAYIGVLIDDLLTHGAPEPYRMFTSRAEYRLQLREDNADLRLCPLGQDLGVLSQARFEHFQEKSVFIALKQKELAQIHLIPGAPLTESIKAALNIDIQKQVNVLELLKRPDVSIDSLKTHFDFGLKNCADSIAEQIEIQAKYHGYIERQQEEINKLRRQEKMKIPVNFDFNTVRGLSSEVKEKLLRATPETLGQAGRIPGITPAALSLLLVHLKKIQSEAAS